MVAEIRVTGASIDPVTSRELFDSGYIDVIHLGGQYHPYAVSSDGERFLIPRPENAPDNTAPAPINVVVNWTATLNQK